MATGLEGGKVGKYKYAKMLSIDWDYIFLDYFSKILDLLQI